MTGKLRDQLNLGLSLVENKRVHLAHILFNQFHERLNTRARLSRLVQRYNGSQNASSKADT